MRIEKTKSFDRDIKKLAKKHFPIKIIKTCVEAIITEDDNILRKIKDHSLKGKWQGYREFHPSRAGNYGTNFDGWIVVYKIQKNRLILTLVTTGNHEILDK